MNKIKLFLAATALMAFSVRGAVNTGPVIPGLPPGSTVSNLTVYPDIIAMTNDTSAPSSSLWTQYQFNTPNPTNFLVLGASAYGNVGGPFNAYFAPSFDQTGGSNTKIQPASANGIEFGIDSDQFVIRNSGSTALKVLVNGVDNFTTFNVPGGGTEYFTYVIFAAKQPRTILLEGLGYFYSVYVPITNGFLNVQPTRTRTMVILGDSFTEEDYTTGAKAWGPSTRLSELYPGWNVVALGEGGTGWYNAGVGNGYGQGTNFLGRVQDVTAFNPNAVIIWGGINDSSYCTNTSQTNIVFGNATNILVRLRSALPSAPIFVVGPQFPRTATGGDSTLFNETNLLGAACATVNNCTYIDPIAEPWITGNVASPGSGNAVYYTLGSDTTHPTQLGSGYQARRIYGAINQGLANLNTSVSVGSVSGGGFVGGQYYTNGYTTPIQVSAVAELSQAAVAGNVQLSLWILGSTTNFANQKTLASSLVTTNSVMLNGIVPAGGVYTFTNQSTGAGNSAAVAGGQVTQF